MSAHNWLWKQENVWPPNSRVQRGELRRAEQAEFKYSTLKSVKTTYVQLYIAVDTVDDSLTNLIKAVPAFYLTPFGKMVCSRKEWSITKMDYCDKAPSSSGTACMEAPEAFKWKHWIKSNLIYWGTVEGRRKRKMTKHNLTGHRSITTQFKSYTYTNYSATPGQK